MSALGKILMLGALLEVSSSVFAQNEQVLRGRIVDSKGEPIIGAVVNVAEQSRISLTDKDGYFSLKKVGSDDEICASSLGYKNAQVKADFKDGFRIVMEDDTDEYLHTMPVPFGRKAKKLITEATSVVTGEELQKHPVTVLQNAFTSTVNGMETYEWSSEPGWSETAMYIRGIRTM
ncbi:MAG TPA: carboxypeptidase-like regulatory domain-containing protein, partial [Xylanibacter oryzae]|nr:carboxypeptidase-like regulatory domain-containing protein [Xylanibacter oryzae]